MKREGSPVAHSLNEPLLMPLARFAAATKFEDIPQKVIREAKLSLIDTLGCIIHGYWLEESSRIIQLEKEIGGRPEATIFCSGDRVSVIAAARANGYIGDIAELNDLSNGHSGIGAIPPSLAMAEYGGASGKSLLKTIVIGYEVAGRIYDTFYPNLRDESCVSIPGFVNSFASAAIASIMLGIGVEKIFQAMNIAGSFAAIGPRETNAMGGTIKPYTFGGWPAGVGIYSAFCAKHGVTGTPTILEGSKGLIKMIAHTFDPRPISHRLGERWALEMPRRKAQACCGYAHSPIEAALATIRENNICVDEINQMDLFVAPYTISLVGGETPPNAMTSKFSLRYLVAVAITNMRSIAPEDTMEECYNLYMSSRGLPQLMEKININPEPSYMHYSFSKIRITTRSGTEYSKYIPHPKGDPENPLTERELIEKFRQLSGQVFKSDEMDQIIEQVHTLEKKDDIGGLIGSLIAK